MRRSLAVVAVAALALGACGRAGAPPEPTAGAEVAVLEMASMPAALSGLAVEAEDVSGTLSRVDSAFVDALGLYSLRRAPEADGGAGLVQATLQVSRFPEGARYTSERFRQTVVNQIGGSAPRAVRLGERTVYLTTGTKQSIAVWFSGRHMFVLASRADYDHPRSLLREALELSP